MDSSFITLVDNCIDRELAKEFECPICLHIMPSVCELDACGHLFCKGCVVELNECTVCRSKSLSYHSSTYLQRQVMDLKVKCVHSDCNAVTTYAEVGKHVKLHLTFEYSIDLIQKNNKLKTELETEFETELETSFTIVGNIMDFVRIFRSLSLVFNKVTLQFSENFIKIIETSEFNDIIYSIKFKVSKFVVYNYCKDHCFTIKLERLMGILQTLGNDDILTFKCKHNNDNILSVLIKSGEVTIEYTVDLDKNSKYCSLPNYRADCWAKLPTKYIFPFFTKSKCVNISINALKLVIKDNSKPCIALSLTDKESIAISARDGVPISGNYNINAMIKFAMETENDTVKLCMKNRGPLVASFSTYYTLTNIIITQY
jgi:hypothetical protein